MNTPRGGRRYSADYMLYGVGSLARQLASVIMVPIYTHFLSPSDYGAVEIVTLLTASMALLAGMNLGEGVFRYYHDRRVGADSSTVVMTALIVAVSLGALGAAVLCLLAPFLSSAFIVAPYTPALVAVGSMTLITEACISIVACHMRLLGDASTFLLAGLLRLALQVAVNLLFVVHFAMGAMGMILGGLVSTALVAVCVLPYTLRRVSFHFSRDTARALIAFGGPLVIANIANFYLQSSDRLFLGSISGLAQVGIYALAARLAQAYISLVHDPFEQIWEPEKYRLWTAHQDPEPFRRAFRLITAVLLVAGVAISVFAREIFHVLAARSFAGAAVIAPPAVAAALFGALVRFCRFGSLFQSKPANIWGAAWGTAVLTTVLLAVLVPSFGAVGAATAMALSAMIRLIVEDRLASRCVNLGLPWVRFSIAFVLGTLVVAAGFFITATVVATIACKVLLLCAFVIALFAFGYVTGDDRRFLLQLLASFRGR